MNTLESSTPETAGGRADEVVSLQVLADQLLRAAAAAPAGRSARTLAAGEHLRSTLLALTAGTRLAEHDSPGSATLQVLRGRLRVTAAAEAWDLGPHDHLAIPPVRHGVLALEDAAVLLTVAHDTAS